MATCQSVMTRSPVCCLADDPVERVAKIMHFENVGAVPIIDDFENQRVIGIVTDRDLALRVIGEKLDIEQTTIADVMTAIVWTCQPDDPLQVALDKMIEHQVRRLPIVTETGQIAGIIAQADIATRTQNADQTANVVRQISEPNPHLIMN